MRYTDDDFLSAIIPIRKHDSHKGDYGRVAILSGCRDYLGAPYFSSMGALRTGSGIVMLAFPECIHSILTTKLNEPVFCPLICDDGKITLDGAKNLLTKLKNYNAMLIGPGLGRNSNVTNAVLYLIENSEVPLVIDADGINAISGHIDVLSRAKHPVILTPHDGEFCRICDVDTSKPRADMVKEFAVKHNCILLLKGHRTLIASPDGELIINSSGNPGMAKGGSGDVLAGIIVSLLGQKINSFHSAAAGAYIHGKAGDLCANAIGEYGMLPSDMLLAIPKVLRKFNSREW